eukprot:m.82522 g.82522  ORF g.82522 m.82522 type:complete len:302 (-) comp9474_c0_seq1:34-939(-)
MASDAPKGTPQAARTPRRQHPMYSEPNQELRHSLAVQEKNTRMLDIRSVADLSRLKGKRVVVTGGNRGLGLALVKELLGVSAHVSVLSRGSSSELDSLAKDKNVEVVTGVDVAVDDSVKDGVAKLAPEPPVDIVINNAGYFYSGPSESVKAGTMNFSEQLKQMNICASGPLRVTASLHARKLLQHGSKVVIITSQAGSVEWRFTQNANEGGDYGHHMSRAACNIAGVLLSEELKDEGIAVGLLHPGFNRTSMTKRYEDIWDKEGAVEVDIGACRVLHEAANLSMDTTGQFINCEDGLPIPW